jgi:hypothetical protein
MSLRQNAVDLRLKVEMIKRFSVIAAALALALSPSVGLAKGGAGLPKGFWQEHASAGTLRNPVKYIVKGLPASNRHTGHYRGRAKGTL